MLERACKRVYALCSLNVLFDILRQTDIIFKGKSCAVSEKITIFAPSKYKQRKKMEAMDFKKYSDEEFKEALRATLNLKKEWMATVAQREKELCIQ